MVNDRKTDPFASVKILEYRYLLYGRWFFIMGLRMLGTLVGWWVYNLTNDPFAIGLIGLAEVIPAISLALYAGHVIDLSEKRKLILRGIFLYFFTALILIFLSSGFTSTHLSAHWIAICIYGVIFFTGVITIQTVFNLLLPYSMN